MGLTLALVAVFGPLLKGMDLWEKAGWIVVTIGGLFFVALLAIGISEAI